MISLKALLCALPLIAAACASASGTFHPLGPDHPASAQASELPIQDPAGALWTTESTTTAPAAEPAGAYACPMHPEVSSAEPGRCPKCGMELEKSAGHHHDG